MKSNEMYKSWRDELLSQVSNEICARCTDERKEQHVINYDNPLACGCRCDRVESILESVREIDGDIG